MAAATAPRSVRSVARSVGPARGRRSFGGGAAAGLRPEPRAVQERRRRFRDRSFRDGRRSAIPLAERLEQPGESGERLGEAGVAALEERAPFLGHRLGVLEVLLEQPLGVTHVETVDVAHVHQVRSSTRTPCAEFLGGIAFRLAKRGPSQTSNPTRAIPPRTTAATSVPDGVPISRAHVCNAKTAMSRQANATHESPVFITARDCRLGPERNGSGASESLK